MLNQIMDGIGAQLQEAFGQEGIGCSQEDQQVLQKPCFLLSLVRAEQKLFPGSRYHRAYELDVQYVPGEGQGQSRGMNQVAEKLFQVLAWVQTDSGQIRGTDMSCEKKDGVLHFFVSYDLYVRKEGPKEEAMGELAVSSMSKEESQDERKENG